MTEKWIFNDQKVDICFRKWILNTRKEENMEITAYMFGVPLFTYNGSLEVIDEGLQYKVLEWQLVDMKRYNSLWTVIRPDGFVEIYNEEGELIYKDFLIHSEDFVRKLKNKIMFDEMRQRDDYFFSLNEMRNVIDGLRNNWMENMDESGDPYRGCATLHVGHIDIELNVYTEEQCGNTAGGKKPRISYYVCVKNQEEWRSDTCLDVPVNVDWNSDNWARQLEEDMFCALNDYVSEKKI